ncbi:hypothetical protein FE257_006433 [Aspergillus nanangensis]|uniref:Glycosyl hydrolase family 43 protein n=1 Tax=Aspergillus nanangensis TaxID=2582783 RepID=A0AAD4CY09_ASPNN|nr:hypothetical protein FE257_006433 [Aspergillus nanangensis]
MKADLFRVLDRKKDISTPSTPSLCRDEIRTKSLSEPPPTTTAHLSGTEKAPSKWTRRKFTWISTIAFISIAIIVIVITVPVMLLRNRHSPDDPSYSQQTNRPRRAMDNFPDPGLIQFNGTWIAYGTNAAINNTEVPHVPVATSEDFANWTRIRDYDAMPTIATWETSANHWAPDVIQRNDGKFLLYYSGELKDWTRHHCVGVAISTTNDPLGPFTPHDKPVACPRQHGGAIDPSAFRDIDGKLYIVYKADANSIGNGGTCNNSKKPILTVPILLQELEEDGVTPVGDPVEILYNEDIDGPLVEAPNLIRTQGLYYLFFSSHCYRSPGYDIKYAYSTELQGPYVRAARPLLKTGDFGLRSPGGATVSQDGTKMVFHADCDSSWRCMYAAAIDISVNSTVTLASL